MYWVNPKSRLPGYSMLPVIRNKGEAVENVPFPAGKTINLIYICTNIT